MGARVRHLDRDGKSISLAKNLLILTFSLNILCVPSFVIAQESPDSRLYYELQPLYTSSQLTALKVVMRFRADADGQTVIDLPNEYGGEGELYKALLNLSVSGGLVERTDNPSEAVIRSTPLSSIVFSYEIAVPPGAKDTDWPTSIFTFKDLRPTAFRVLGPTLFSTVEGRDADPVAFRWSGPKAWTFVSDLQQLPVGATQNDLVQSVVAGGPSVQVSEIRTSSGVVKLAQMDTASEGDQDIRPALKRVMQAQDRFWGDGPKSYLVVYTNIPTRSAQAMGGTNLGRAFDLAATENVPLSERVITISHEYFHNWVPFKLGAPEKVDSGAWFIEGFTDYYARMLALESGAIDKAAFAKAWNEAFAEHAASPVKTVANAVIATDRWTNPDLDRLAYNRGAIFAAHLAHRARLKNVSLDDVMRQVQKDAQADAALWKADYGVRMMKAASALGLDVSGDIDAFIVSGKELKLAKDSFGRCFTVDDETVPALDPGYDPDKTAETGIFTGVRAASNAYKAGLRDGMRRLERLSGNGVDSSVPYTFKVADSSGAERVISYLPQSTRLIDRQHMEVKANCKN